MDSTTKTQMIQVIANYISSLGCAGFKEKLVKLLQAKRLVIGRLLA
jgi:hypothetical protein